VAREEENLVKKLGAANISSYLSVRANIINIGREADGGVRNGWPRIAKHIS